MKSFKQIMAEVAEPISDEEKKFKAQHKVEIKPHPVAKETQHKAEKPKARRKADQEGDANYDLAYESVEQIDEISKDLVGRYIKKAGISMADAGRDTNDDRPHIRKRGINKIVNRRMGTSDAVRKLTGKARVAATEAADTASPDESSMAMKQAEFIAYVGREMGEHLKAGKEFPEWMQNKLSKLQQAAQDLHSNFGSHGGDEDVNEAKGKKVLSAKDIKRALQSVKAQPKDKVSLKKAPWDKNEEVNEVTQSAVKKPVNVTGPDGKVRTVLRKKAQKQDDHGQDVMGTRVESNQLDELSPSLLKRYQKKADKDADRSFNKAGDIEMKSKTDVWSDTKSKDGKKHGALMDRGEKRHAGAMLARKKLQAKGHKSPKMSYESSEQIDEISKDMTDRYMKKAMPQYKRAQTKQHVGGYGSTTQKGADANKERLRKRHKGIGSVFKRQGGGEVVDRDYKRHSMTGKKAPYQHESVQYIDEAVKAGNMKLRDGSSIKVTKEDAKLLNQMFKDLNSQNRKQMEKVMMTDKNGFNEIVGFAREAL